MAVRSAALMGGAVLTALLASGCMAVEANPLDVNSPRMPENASAVQQPATADVGDDPLNLAENGATLCSTQPGIGFQEFTVLVHNEALETFTLDDVTLKDPDGLTLVSAEVSPANREGHHKAHGEGDEGAEDGDDGGHGTHGAEPAPAAASITAPAAAEPAGPVEPVPADGYAVSTHEYVNLVVAVSIAEGADAGTAQGVTVVYSTGGQEFTGTHPLVVELTRDGCA
ncbi:hypothetical protein SAMN04488693_10599 [Arthrobacter subterraneus]|uniref:Uncharacterized protein n=1 Tax=Arthrobacter subterraneus TaxID=335973 RepID=A0A1G8H6W6_9MICC|nr:hypothetical protein [Arthrobacter subterraneus]SDI02366.1 hypothetical protein SAMN04488693_10599 [Arthrobacter subterraneus]